MGSSWHFEQGYFETEIVKVGDDAASAETLNGNCGQDLCSWCPVARVSGVAGGGGMSPFGWETGGLSSFLGAVT